MTALRERMMIEDLQLRGLSESTQASYLQAVRLSAEYYHKSPDQITEEELRQYFLYLSNTKVPGCKSKTSTVDVAQSIFVRERGIKIATYRYLNRYWKCCANIG